MMSNTKLNNSGAGTAYLHEHLGSSPVLVGFVVLESCMCIFCRSLFVRLSTRPVSCVEQEPPPSQSTRVHPRCLVWFVLLYLSYSV